jgi:GNAT superfamily N-acetyltransferase
MDIIRRANKKDFNEIYELELYLNNYCAKVNSELFIEQKEINKEDRSDRENCFVIDHDNEIIGFFEAYVVGALDENGTPCKRTFIVETFVIKEKYQGLKFGEKLFMFLEDQAKKRGCKRIILKTLNEEKVVNFYRKMGMDIDYCNMGKKIEPISQNMEFMHQQWKNESKII